MNIHQCGESKAFYVLLATFTQAVLMDVVIVQVLLKVLRNL